MKLHQQHLIPRLIRKARSSPCRSKVAAAGIDHRGRIVTIANNTPRLYTPGGGIHAEQALLYQSPRSVREIVIIRVGRSGDILPVRPCAKCRRMASKFGVTITAIVAV